MAKKPSGLGKGLDALFIETGIDEKGNVQNTSDVTTVRISDIEPDKNQPRKAFNEEALQVLADSITAHGVLQPIVVRSAAPEDADENTKKLLEGKYRIVSGERRWRASKMAGLTEIPVVVKELNDTEASAVMLVENLQREDLTPVETAKGLRRLIEEFGLTHEETAKLVGISRPGLTNSLRLLQLPENVLDFLDSGDITPGHARTLIPLGDEKEINEALDVVLAKQLSVRETEKLVKNILSSRNKAEKDKTPKDADREIYLGRLEEKISSSLGRKAFIAQGTGKKGAGKLEIEFYSSDDLEALLKNICGSDIFSDL
ncbi:MAG: ParB/RepB/Spo0J family partition protein [Clostridia bacterium]|nr:ParB/RepB/Spo0J family partition protein [Clostridia bacterium]